MTFVEQVEHLPKTCVLEARVDIVSLATLLRYFESLDIRPLNRAQLVRTIIEGLCQIMVVNGNTEKFTSTVEALNYMNSKGFHFGQVGQKGNRNLVSELVKEHSNMDGLGITMSNQRITKKDIPIGEIKTIKQKGQDDGIDTSMNIPEKNQGGIAGLPAGVSVGKKQVKV